MMPRFCALLLIPALAARAGEFDCGHRGRVHAAPRAFDERTGADPLQYARDTRVDYRHLRLELTFDEVARKSLTGRAIYTVRAVAPGVRGLALDATDFENVVVRVDGQPASFSYDDERISLVLPADLATDADATLGIEYRVVDPQDGLVFVPADPAYPGRPVSFHTQGQTSTNRAWFPCHDQPHVRMTSETIVTAPQPLFVVGNGRLVEQRDTADGKGRTFHWRMDVPHPPYLLSLAAADFAIERDEVGGVSVEYYVPKPWAAHSRRTFERTPRMVELFGRVTGVPYPYAKYAQVVVPHFEAGGMENISASTMNENCLIDERAALDDDSDGLIAHELAHQWYGDLLTCRTWAHAWLNEGFASYLDEYWFEHWRGRDWYETSFRTTYRRVADADSTSSPGGLVLREYDSDWEPFGQKGGLIYSKGSGVLATLRHALGDDLFWKAMQTYTKRFAARPVETADFRRVVEEVTGRDMERFFEQYCYRPGVPHIRVDYDWDGASKSAVMRFEQTQPINEKTPAFAVTVDVAFCVGDQWETVSHDIAERKSELRRAFAVEPSMVCVDPHAGLLAKLDVDLPRAMRLRILAKGPTAVARLDAARDLEGEAKPDAVEALAACLGRGAEFWRVRATAADSLGGTRTPAARDALLHALTHGDGISEPRVRRAAVRALSGFRHDDAVIAALAGFARGDPSYAVEEAATRALGDVRAASAADILVANLTRPSQYDGLRLAAVGALADLRDGRGRDAARKAAAYGGSAYRTRPRFVSSLPRFVEPGDDAERRRTREFLEDLLYDPQPRTVEAAIDALAVLGDSAAITALRARAAAGAAGRATRLSRRRDIDSAIERIRKADPSPAALRSLEEELRQLRKDVDKLREKQERATTASSRPSEP